MSSLSSLAADSEPAEKPLTRAQKKNERKKQKKKEKKASEVAFEIEEITTGFEEVSLSEKKSSEINSQLNAKTKKENKVKWKFYIMCVMSNLSVYVYLSLSLSLKQSTDEKASAGAAKGTEAVKAPQQESDSARDKLKRERALRKKLKQINELEARIASGEIPKPDRDQLTKIAKKEEIEAELLDLAEDSS